VQLTALNTDKTRIFYLLKHYAYFSTIILLCFSFSITALWINTTHTHYIGNNYAPFNITWASTALLLSYIGACVFYSPTHHITQKIKEVGFFFGSMALVLLGTNAVQYTPFPPIDQNILNWSAWMHTDIANTVTWSHAHPMLYKSMEYVYNSLDIQLTYLPLVLILFGRFERLHEYYFLLLTTALIGFTFYYFFPTTAPASIINSPYFSEAQHATGLKFKQIHNHIQPTTLEGGMIAFPSFHVIWAWLCVWLVRDWVWVFRPLLILNIGIAISCVLLGWHYVLDIIASMMVLGMAHGVHQYSRHSR
jgi:hypothetical protein